MIEHWKHLIWTAAVADPLMITGVRKIVQNVQFSMPAKLLVPGLDYTDICYTAAKGRQLARNYWDQDAVNQAVEKLTNRLDKPHSSVSVQLQGGVKDSRSQGYCMQNMVISMWPGGSSVDIYYRSTELIQKFLADLIFFSQQLPPIFEALNIQPSEIRFKFANTYLSAVFMPIFLRYEDDPSGFFRALELNDPKFYRTCGLATRRFFNETHNYTYRTRVKMFEYWKEYVDPVKVKPLGIKLNKLKGNIPIDDGDDDAE